MPPTRPQPTATDQATRADRGFFACGAKELARRLLGQRLVRVCGGRRVAGVIVETEAYLGVTDEAAHTYGGRRTPRNEAMWGDAGTAYVYFTYGMHHCFNIAAVGPGEPEAVLIRALEPTEGLDAMRRRRPAARRETALCSGPAKLCAALDIDRRLTGHDMTGDGALFVERLRSRALPSRAIAVGPRIGIGYAGAWVHKPLRFAVRGCPHVSRPHPWEGSTP